MKLFTFIAVALLIIGGIFHTQISEYFDDMSLASSDSDSGSGGGTSVFGSIQRVGNSGNALMNGVGGALNR